MANEASGIVTSVWRSKLAQTFALSGSTQDPRRLPATFKIGEGGWQVVGSVKEPKTPSAARTDLESEGSALTGTLAFTSGGVTVTGTGTSFSSQVSVGQYVKVAGGGTWGEVLTVDSNTQITLAAGWGGSSLSGQSGRVASEPWYTFRKALDSADVYEETSGVLYLGCEVATGEANDDGFGVAPDFYELGVFDAEGTLMFYTTFPVETKIAGRTLLHEHRLTW